MNDLTNVLATTRNEELLSYIINQDPILKAEIDLPVQGESIAPIGEIIVNNERYKNAFLNVCNVIGLTIMADKRWQSPWDLFTEKGKLAYGQTIREIFVDLANVYDYNTYKNSPTSFLANVVPNVYEYLHEVNYEKFYKTTTSDEEIAMAFTTEGGLLGLISGIVGSLYEGYEYDKYQVEKYMLARRIVDGTITAHQLTSNDTRGKVAEMKAVSNKMTFRKPNYNPAGVRNFSSFANQFLLASTDFDSEMSTTVLATSYFRNDAELKSNLALIDGYGDFDIPRLQELLGVQYKEFTSAELVALAKVPATIIDRDFFQVYNYAFDTRKTDFFNPESLRTNHWLHTKKVMSTSPYANACVFTTDAQSVTGITISPAESTVSAGLTVQLAVSVATTGFANKAVKYEVEEAPGETEGKVTVSSTGLVKIPADYDPTDPDDPNPVIIKVTSIFDEDVSETATITVL